jgi:hypothetical protein
MSTFNPFNVMSTKNELWFKEPVTIFLTNGQEIDGVNLCFVRFMKKNETIEDVDTFKEFEKLMGGTTVGTLYEVNTTPDGREFYTEVDEYDDYGSSCDYEFVVNPLDEVELV